MNSKKSIIYIFACLAISLNLSAQEAEKNDKVKPSLGYEDSYSSIDFGFVSRVLCYEDIVFYRFNQTIKVYVDDEFGKFEKDVKDIVLEFNDIWRGLNIKVELVKFPNVANYIFQIKKTGGGGGLKYIRKGTSGDIIYSNVTCVYSGPDSNDERNKMLRRGILMRAFLGGLGFTTFKEDYGSSAFENGSIWISNGSTGTPTLKDRAVIRFAYDKLKSNTPHDIIQQIFESNQKSLSKKTLGQVATSSGSKEPISKGGGTVVDADFAAKVLCPGGKAFRRFEGGIRLAVTGEPLGSNHNLQDVITQINDLIDQSYKTIQLVENEKEANLVLEFKSNNIWDSQQKASFNPNGSLKKVNVLMKLPFRELAEGGNRHSILKNLLHAMGFARFDESIEGDSIWATAKSLRDMKLPEVTKRDKALIQYAYKALQPNTPVWKVRQMVRNDLSAR